MTLDDFVEWANEHKLRDKWNQSVKKIKLQNKATEEVRVLEVVQKDSIQGFWCVESVDLWKWYPHDQWKEIK